MLGDKYLSKLEIIFICLNIMFTYKLQYEIRCFPIQNKMGDSHLKINPTHRHTTCGFIYGGLYIYIVNCIASSACKLWYDNISSFLFFFILTCIRLIFWFFIFSCILLKIKYIYITFWVLGDGFLSRNQISLITIVMFRSYLFSN